MRDSTGGGLRSLAGYKTNRSLGDTAPPEYTQTDFISRAVAERRPSACERRSDIVTNNLPVSVACVSCYSMRCFNFLCRLRVVWA